MELLSLAGFLLLAAMIVMGLTHPRRRSGQGQPDEIDLQTAYLRLLERVERLERTTLEIRPVLEAVLEELRKADEREAKEEARRKSQAGRGSLTPVDWALAVIGLDPDTARCADRRRAAFRRAVKKAHPDHGGSDRMLRDVLRAQAILEEAFG